jgi:peptidoglycan/xylan/chitin deacetylase (PgdA/CDA1 family)
MDADGRRRDFVGYGSHPPKVTWPHGARIVVNFVINYEEGAERSPLDGDAVSDAQSLSRYPMPSGVRDLQSESLFEYGGRVGVWRLLDMFRRHAIPVTFCACGRALERNPMVARAIRDLGHEPCSHGYRWGEHFRMDEAEERREIQSAVEAIERSVGERPVGWGCRYAAGERTRRLLAEEGGFIYDADAHNDDLPYYVQVLGRPWLVVPYTTDANDGRYMSAPGFATPQQFFDYLTASFDCLYAEGENVPKMMPVGLHTRISGRPARATAVERFITYAKQRSGVWFARRDEIARFWLQTVPPP